MGEGDAHPSVPRFLEEIADARVDLSREFVQVKKAGLHAAFWYAG